MSRKFMILMLIVFGGLLYLTSYALNKGQQPDPTPQDNEDKAKEMAQKDYEQRMKEMKKAHPQNGDKQLIETPQLKTPPKKGAGKKMPLPPGQDKHEDRRPTDTVITSDWTHMHPDGAAGIEQEIKFREKHATKPVTLGPAPAINPASH